MKLTLNEKLDFISECEEVNLHSQSIEALLETKEKFESLTRFNSVEELMADLETEEAVDLVETTECDKKGLPLIYDTKHC